MKPNSAIKPVVAPAAGIMPTNSPYNTPANKATIISIMGNPPSLSAKVPFYFREFTTELLYIRALVVIRFYLLSFQIFSNFSEVYTNLSLLPQSRFV